MNTELGSLLESALVLAVKSRKKGPWFGLCIMSFSEMQRLPPLTKLELVLDARYGLPKLPLLSALQSTKGKNIRGLDTKFLDIGSDRFTLELFAVNFGLGGKHVSYSKRILPPIPLDEIKEMVYGAKNTK